MGTITISVNDDIEKRFRELARELYPEKKGYLGKAVTSAIQQWIEDVSQKKIAERQLRLLEKGYKMGKIKFQSREELYER